MFFRSHGAHYKRGGRIFGIFRLFLSLIVIFFLLLVLFAAYRSFNPELSSQNQLANLQAIKNDPKGYIKSLLSSDSFYGFITTLLSFNPQVTLNRDNILKGDPSQSNRLQKNSALNFRFAIISDSHNDDQNLKKALSQAKENGARFVIGLGDYTDVGTLQELQIAKSQFDSAGLSYYSTAGDHDLWDSRNKNLNPAQNYQQVFGAPFNSFEYQGARMILLYNSDNYLGVDETQRRWLEEEFDRIKKDSSAKTTFVFLSIPLEHPSSDHVMGKVNEKLKNQSEYLSDLFARFGVAEVIAGDTHQFSRYRSERFNINLTTIGAVTSARNLQSPRYALVDVYSDGSYNIQDTEIK